ncbi:unnamed protein product [Vitrella brassicaformis CCMP3155]|uniref:Uncharacterized protein n=1 Tax=Vitrella brassicaformis (strain CCMP3155) TaxID=1169540 RepID=A0A0G4GN48_VITBC|nr:unnamed protein product [Vitrella brassicaformis CCMP3155]|eukprot:CEM31558.1 unnamed protein product [Vitrella brassicaformis CCMP3155]
MLTEISKELAAIKAAVGKYNSRHDAITSEYNKTKEFCESRLQKGRCWWSSEAPSRTTVGPTSPTSSSWTISWKRPAPSVGSSGRGVQEPKLRAAIYGGATEDEKAQAYKDSIGFTKEEWTEVVYPYPSMLLTNNLLGGDAFNRVYHSPTEFTLPIVESQPGRGITVGDIIESVCKFEGGSVTKEPEDPDGTVFWMIGSIKKVKVERYVVKYMA